jgi:hypothetical protein
MDSPSQTVSLKSEKFEMELGRLAPALVSRTRKNVNQNKTGWIIELEHTQITCHKQVSKLAHVDIYIIIKTLLLLVRIPFTSKPAGLHHPNFCRQTLNWLRKKLPKKFHEKLKKKSIFFGIFFLNFFFLNFLGKFFMKTRRNQLVFM